MNGVNKLMVDFSVKLNDCTVFTAMKVDLTTSQSWIKIGINIVNKISILKYGILRCTFIDGYNLKYYIRDFLKYLKVSQKVLII